MPLDDRAIAICATFTAENIEPGLAFWVRELGLEHAIRFAGYNQIFQTLLDPAGLFGRNRGFNVALVRFDDRFAAGDAARLADAVRVAAGFSAPLVLSICPPAANQQAESAAAIERLRAGTADLATVHLLSPEDVLSLYPVNEVFDAHGDELGHVPYTPLFFAALATALARKIHSIASRPYKVIALDCDDTLWAGICGEDGPRNVVVDGPHRALQEFAAGRRRSGMLLALCSKNNEEDVVETFQAHPDMPLRLEDFTARRINWDAKSANLMSLAAELELGLDSFILLDDNPKECSEAQLTVPEVLALALPARPEEIPEFLRHVWAFDRASVTDEDRARAELYAQRAARMRAELAAPNLESFLASLELEIAIAPPERTQMARVAQLTQRTNQMNTTGVRRTEGELQGLSGAEIRTVHVKDRFGSYGLSGVMIFLTAGRSLVAETFLLSCRALGRGVEHRMVAHLGEVARERGLEWVEIPYLESQRNRPAALFLESLGKPAADAVLRMPAEDAARVRYHAGQAAARPHAPEEDAYRKPPERRMDYQQIASELRDPAAILDRIRAGGPRTAPRAPKSDPPRTPLERELAEIWAELLHLRSVGVHDSFFEFGGHSLLAVQLLSQVRQRYGVDLSLEVVYSGEFTVAELAKAVELKEIEQGGADYQDLLQELEGLSDEEVRALLAEEQDAS